MQRSFFFATCLAATSLFAQVPDRLLVGQMTLENYADVTKLPLPAFTNQKFCGVLELSEDVFVWAYVPTSAERGGNFSQFAGSLIDPLTNQPFPGGIIPASRLPNIFAWRLSGTPPDSGSCRPIAALPQFSAMLQILPLTGSGPSTDPVTQSPRSFLFGYQFGNPVPDPQTFSVTTSRGNGIYIPPPIDQNTGKPADWLRVESISAPAGQSVTVTFQVSIIPSPTLKTGNFATFQALVVNAQTKGQLIFNVTLITVTPTSWVAVDQPKLNVFYNHDSQQLDAPTSLKITSLGAATNFTVSVQTVTPPLSATGGRPWLRVLPTSGTGPTATLSLFYDTELLKTIDRGAYLAVITINAPGAPNSPVYVTASLNVSPAPDFTTDPTALSFNLSPSASPPQQIIYVLPIPAVALPNFEVTSWTPGTDPAWLTISPPSLTVPKDGTGQVIVGINPSAVLQGPSKVYKGAININAGIATGAEIEVTLNATTGYDPAGTGPQLISHVADATEWKTTITLVNTDKTTQAPYTLKFRRGQRSQRDVLALEGVGTLASNEVSGTIPAGGTTTLRTAGAPGTVLWEGWAELTAPATVGGVAVFRQRISSTQDSEAAVPVKKQTGSQFLLAFDNTQPDAKRKYDTGFALVNATDQPAQVTFTVRAEDGSTVPSSDPAINLPAYGHSAFQLANQITATAGRRGVVMFQSTQGQLAGLGLRFNQAAQSFTSFETLVSQSLPAVQNIAQIADGGGWRTSIVLVNPNTTSPALVNLLFTSGQGTAPSRAVPLTGLAYTPGNSLSISIPRGGSRVIETGGQSLDPLWQGWARISGDPVTGFAVFRAETPGQADKEGTVPFVPGGRNRFIVPFENSSSVVTSLALVNTSGNVSAAFRNEQGNAIGAAATAVPGVGHQAFELYKIQNALLNQSGSAEFSTTGSELFGLGLRFNDLKQAFTSLPILLQ